MSAFQHHAAVVTQNGLVYGIGVSFTQFFTSWGTLTPLQMPSPTSKAVSFKIGSSYGLMLDSFGDVWVLATDAFGTFGFVEVPFGSTPTWRKISLGGKQQVAITAGKFHACSLSLDGIVSCFGYGESGLLGDGRLTSTGFTPVQTALPAGFIAKDVSCGFEECCAISLNGEVACWYVIGSH